MFNFTNLDEINNPDPAFTDHLTWMNLRLQPALSRRTGHTTICLPYRHENERRDQVLMFGGGDNEEAFYQDLINIMIPF